MNDTRLLDLQLTPDEARVISSALSRSIIQLSENADSYDSLDEVKQVYITLKQSIDAKYPNWLITNNKVKKLLEA